MLWHVDLSVHPQIPFRSVTELWIGLYSNNSIMIKVSLLYFRWRLVIHGGIDGFSRMPVFLKVSNNNKAETVLEAFVDATDKYGLPLRVRSDKGGENVRVAEYMLRRRGADTKPFIAGRSVHNQRYIF